MTAKNISSSGKVASNEQDQTSFTKPMKKFSSVFPIVLLALVVVSGAAAAYFYNQLNTLKTNPQAAAQEETAELIARVSKLIVLPKDETPTIATVQDPEVLKEQAFFVNAKQGDKVLIYTNAKKAILYDPVNNKIVEVAPVNIGNPQAAPAEEIVSPAPVEESGEETPEP